MGIAVFAKKYQYFVMDLPIKYEKTQALRDRNIIISHVQRAEHDGPLERYAHLHDVVELVIFHKVSGRLVADQRAVALKGSCAVWLPAMAIHDFALEPGPAAWTVIQYRPLGAL